MRRIVMILAAMCVIMPVHAAESWELKKYYDDDADEVDCRLKSPTNAVRLLFSNDAASVHASQPLKGPGGGTLSVRVDDNPRISLALRFDAWPFPYFAVIENRDGGLDKLRSQLPTGRAITYRILGKDDLPIEGEIPLAGFKPVWEKYEACLKDA